MTLSEIRAIPAIDLHAHYGCWQAAAGRGGSRCGDPGTLDLLLRNSAYAGIALSVVSHLGTLFAAGRGEMRFNRICAQEIEGTPRVLMLATLNPLWEGSFDNVRMLIQDGKCFGVKLHPTAHGYCIREYGEAIYRFAAEENVPIVTHTGESYCLPEDFVPFANEYPTVKTVLSHLGYSVDGRTDRQIHALERARHGNLFTDTSSIHSLEIDLIERAVAELGHDRILFGTDAGIYFSPAQRARIDCAGITSEAKQDILYKNALRIFPRLKDAYTEGCGELVRWAL